MFAASQIGSRYSDCIKIDVIYVKIYVSYRENKQTFLIH